MFANFWTDIATLMATIDPFSVIPVYIGLTHDLTADRALVFYCAPYSLRLEFFLRF